MSEAAGLNSREIVLRDAVVAAINAGAFALTFTARGALVPKPKLVEGEVVGEVWVVPTSASRDPARGDADDDELNYSVEVGWICRVDPNDEEDQLNALRVAEQIDDYLRETALTEASQFVWQGSRRANIFEGELLLRENEIACIIEIDYLMERS